MLSLLGTGNFDSATMDEITAATEYLRSLKLTTGLDGDFGFYDEYGNEDLSKYQDFAKLLGLEFKEDDDQSLKQALNEYAAAQGMENYVEFFNSLGQNQNYVAPIQALMAEFAGGTGVNGETVTGKYQEWFDGAGKEIYGSMNQATMQLYKEENVSAHIMDMDHYNKTKKLSKYERTFTQNLILFFEYQTPYLLNISVRC